MNEFKKEIEQTVHDLIIVGSGPAGLSAAVYASRGGLEVIMIDTVPGGELLNIAEIENWPGDSHVLGPELAARMSEHATQFGAKHIFGIVEKIIDKCDIKLVESFDKIYQAKSVIIASGTKERLLGIPGESEYKGSGISYCATCDAAFFKNEIVTVIGGGDTAYKSAEYISRFAKEVHMFLRRDVARAEKIAIDRVHAKDNIEVHYKYSPIEIKGTNGKVSSVVLKNNRPGEHDLWEFETAAVFPLIGTIPNTDFVGDLPILDENRYIVVNDRMETQIPGIFAAGDVIAKGLRQVVTAASDGAIAGEAAGNYIHSLS